MSTVIIVIIITFILTFGEEKTEDPHPFREKLDGKLGFNSCVSQCTASGLRLKAQAGGRQQDFETNSFVVWCYYRMNKHFSPGAA